MTRVDYPRPIQDLIQLLKRLPSVGPRSAERIALWLQREDARFSADLGRAVEQARSLIRSCPRCGFFATERGCAVCDDETRDPSLLCVVEQSSDVLSLEKTGAFRGRYHVLGGKLSPLHHVGPDDLRIGSLAARVRGGGVAELILALAQDVEGEATANYMVDLLGNSGVAITRLAQGLPAGGGLESVDEITLLRALAGRCAWR